jgi:flavorubredoxin
MFSREKGDRLKAREIKPGVAWMGAIDWERRLFDELIPLPNGTSYNAYLVRGSEKTALIDTADPAKSDVLFAQLADIEHIDYIIVQHVEQDHSGSLPLVLERYPDAQIMASSKAAPMIAHHLGVPEEAIHVVEDGETLSLGDRTFQFIYAPWVHWPETMLTYLREEKLLFTCDLFGSHLATDKLFSGDGSAVCEPAKRYYAEIMMPFATLIRGHLDKIAPLEIEMIAPSHGPIHDQPPWILDAYRHWTQDVPENLVVMPYTSMHGSTKLMVDYMIEALNDRGVGVQTFHMSKTDLGEYATRLVDAATVVFATPTVLVGPHPSMVMAAYLTAALRPKIQNAVVIGSFGWGSKAVEKIMEMAGTLRADWMDPVLAQGLPTPETYADLDKLADEIAKRHQALIRGG